SSQRLGIIFFFSSRRRHTRWPRDWSSDVCSSDLVKAVDNTAKVTGPVVSGWTGYWFSALDRGSDGFKTAADRQVHGGMPLLPWRSEERRVGKECRDRWWAYY